MKGSVIKNLSVQVVQMLKSSLEKNFKKDVGFSYPLKQTNKYFYPDFRPMLLEVRFCYQIEEEEKARESFSK